MRKLISTVLTAACISNLALAAAITNPADWDNLRQLAGGTDVKIVLNDASAYRGQFQTVTGEAIVVRMTAGREKTFQRESVLRVSTQGKRHRGRNALIGLAIGLGAGMIVGAASPELGQGTCQHGSCVNAASVALPGFAGAVIGAGIGAAIPTGGWHDVYRAR